MTRKCKQIWQPNYCDTKSFKRGYTWRCFCCGKVRKSCPFRRS